MKQLKGTQTEKNLETAFAGESMARNKYTYFAARAKKDGYEQIAAIFQMTADNEREHAKLWFKALLNNGQIGNIGDTLENLKAAADGEKYEHDIMYAEFAKVARDEGFTQLAYLFDEVGKIEKDHEERYRRLIENVEKARVFESKKDQMWECRNCGYTLNGKKAPEMCPVCVHPKSFFEVRSLSI